MKIKLKRTKNSFSLLRMKTIAGYGLLLTVLSIIVFFVWQGLRKMETLNNSEQFVRPRKKVMNQILEKLFDFSFSDDILLPRDNDKLDKYRMKHEVATDALHGLKLHYQTDGVQHVRIDRVSSLLQEKEKLLFGVMNTLLVFLHTDSLLQWRIFVIISQMAQQLDMAATTENERGGLFKKTEEKSAYAPQREKRKESLFSRRTAEELYPLQEEIHVQYTDFWNKLSAYSDSLQQWNRELNSQIKDLICEFEQATIVQSDNEAKQMTVLREESFCIILFIVVAAILLIVVFYIFIHRDIRHRLAYWMMLETSNRRNCELLVARQNRYDLVLTDMRMLEIDGYGVLSLIRGSNLGQTKTLPVLAVTAQANERPEHFKNEGFTGCLYKPFSLEELLAVTSRIDRLDFAAIMEGEENGKEMLGIFIEDTTEELSEMRDAFSVGNYEKLGHIIHKVVLLWVIIRISISLGGLERMTSMPLEKWNRTLDKRIEKLLEAVGQAIEKAKRLKEKADGNHIDSRG